jgi:hypothetical protein
MMTITSNHHRYLSLDTSCWLTDCCCDLLADALFCWMMISYVLEVFVMETIIASRRGMSLCVRARLSLSLARLQWLIAVAMYGRSSAVLLVVGILLVFLCFERFACLSASGVVQKRILRAKVFIRDNSES